MDNGSYELGQSVSFDAVIEAAREIRPDEIVAPDIQWDPVNSIELTRRFMKYLQVKGLRNKYKVMVVVWAFSPDDYPNWYTEYLKMKPDVIGIGKWLSTKFLARPKVVHFLKEQQIWNYELEHHFLGCAFPGEAAMLAKEGRSMDTSGPIADALNGLKYEIGDNLIELHEQSLKRSLNFSVKLTPEQLQIAKSNCNIMLRYAKEGND